MSMSKLLLCSSLLLLMSAPAASAQTGWPGVRAVAMGGARVALATDNDAITLNPAGIAAGRMYSVEVGYADDLRDSERLLSASVVDSQTSELAAGFGYHNFKRRPEWAAAGKQRLRGQRFDLALAGATAQQLAFGVSGRYVIVQRQDEAGNNADKFKLFTADAGLVYRPSPHVAVGVSGTNLVPSKRPELRPEVAGGVGFQIVGAEVEFDLRYAARTEKLSYALGLSYAAQRMVAVRLGIRYEDATGAWIGGAGIGFMSEVATLDIGSQLRLNPEGSARDRNEQLFLVSVRGILF